MYCVRGGTGTGVAVGLAGTSLGSGSWISGVEVSGSAVSVGMGRGVSGAQAESRGITRSRDNRMLMASPGVFHGAYFTPREKAQIHFRKTPCFGLNRKTIMNSAVAVSTMAAPEAMLR